jgi:hypothetical protein
MERKVHRRVDRAGKAADDDQKDKTAECTPVLTAPRKVHERQFLAICPIVQEYAGRHDRAIVYIAVLRKEAMAYRSRRISSP